MTPTPHHPSTAKQAESAKLQVSPKTAQQFMQQLKHELEQTQQLLQFLDAEKAAIEKRDFDAYTAMLHSKRNLLANIEMLNHQRQQILVDMGFNNDKLGFQAFLAEVPKTWRQQFQGLWDQLSEQLKRCRDLNEVNSKIILHAQIATERLIQLVKGGNPDNTLYRANGRTAGHAESPYYLASA